MLSYKNFNLDIMFLPEMTIYYLFINDFKTSVHILELDFMFTN